MLQDFISNLFSLITDIECWDIDDPSCAEGAAEASDAILMTFIEYPIYYTVLFIMLASIPRYGFRWSVLNDIIIRRVTFFVGFGLTVYTLMKFSAVAALLSATRSDSDVASDIVAEITGQGFLIGIAIYPVLFFVVAFVLNLLHRRKLMTIFRSNTKIFGLI
jgi:hypothetical protein